MIYKLNPDAPAFIPAARIPNTDENNRSQYIYRRKTGNLWSAARGWLKSYRCKACKVILSRKDGPKIPQQIKNCGHITCAECIASSYTINQNPLCPVKDCGKCVDPYADSVSQFS
jgi:hypothetical protein